MEYWDTGRSGAQEIETKIFPTAGKIRSSMGLVSRPTKGKGQGNEPSEAEGSVAGETDWDGCRPHQKPQCVVLGERKARARRRGGGQSPQRSAWQEGEAAQTGSPQEWRERKGAEAGTE